MFEDDIWELRPLREPFGAEQFVTSWVSKGTFDTHIVILHCFTKKTQKTPAKEIERAKRNRKDFLKRGGMNDEEN